ncbi:MAG: YobA family protein [Clostridiales bacterium]|nr:YobA family protein [Clostridiales bacterium]
MTRKIKKAALMLAIAVLCLFAVSCMDSSDAGDKDLDWQGADASTGGTTGETDTDDASTDDDSTTVVSTGAYVASKGRIVKTDGAYFFIFEGDYDYGELVTIHSRSADASFDDLATGDLVEVGTDGSIAESYPGQMSVYTLEILEHGSVDDIDERAISEIESCGYDVIE